MRIDEEFKKLIPPLSVDEFQQLERNIIADGCRDPLVIWEGVLIDGHNRFDICSKHGIDFRTVNKSFTDRDEATLWIINNQFGRRNISDFVRAELALKAEPLIAARAKERQGARNDLNIPANLPESAGKETRDELGGRTVQDRNLATVDVDEGVVDRRTGQGRHDMLDRGNRDALGILDHGAKPGRRNRVPARWDQCAVKVSAAKPDAMVGRGRSHGHADRLATVQAEADKGRGGCKRILHVGPDLSAAGSPGAFPDA